MASFGELSTPIFGDLLPHARPYETFACRELKRRLSATTVF